MKQLCTTLLAVIAIVSTSYAQNLPLTAGSAYPLTGTLYSTNVDAFRLQGNNTYISGYDNSGTNRTGYLQFNSSGSVALAAENATNIALIGANVGIGTTNPSAKLHIIGPLDGSLSALTIGDASAGNTNVPVGASTGGYNIDFHTWRDIVPEQIGARIRAERINAFLPNSALIQSMDLTFYTSYGAMQSQLTEKMRIKSTGYVGIGTTNPDQMLTVNGTIHSKEVKVDTSIPPPDYVFEPTYKLPQLSELKTYLDANHHLPEMPSAAEMDKNGINLSEMNLKLLKKVEELTLYLIDKDKEIKDLKASQQQQIDVLKAQMQSLQKNLTR
jgi:hypothetical protein